MVLSSTVYHPMFPNSCHAGSPYRGANYPHYTNVVQQQQQQHHHTAYSEIHENGTSDVSVYPDSIDQLVAYEQYHRHNVTQSSPNQWPQNSVGSQHYQNSANHGEIAHSTSAVRLGQPQTLASDHYSFVNCVNGQVDGSNQATASDVEDEDDGDGGSTKGTESSFQSSRPGKTRTREKYRVVYSDHQRLELEKEFHYNRYITIRRKSEMASFLGLSERQIKIWFQNRRAKERKQLKKLQELYSSPNVNDPTGATTTSSFVGAGSASDPTDRFNLANTNTSPLRHLNFPQIDNVPIKHEHPASHRPTSHLNS